MGEVVKFYKKNAAEHPDAVLEQAIGQFESVLLVGYDEEGCLEVRASLNLVGKDILWLIESFKARLLAGVYCDEVEDD